MVSSLPGGSFFSQLPGFSLLGAGGPGGTLFGAGLPSVIKNPILKVIPGAAAAGVPYAPIPAGGGLSPTPTAPKKKPKSGKKSVTILQSPWFLFAGTAFILSLSMVCALLLVVVLIK